MKNELDYFYVGGRFGGCQDWFWDPVMRLGGCAALAACDSCICLARDQLCSRLYPFDAGCLAKRDYMTFARRMKCYLHPRLRGIDRLELFMEGLRQYFRDVEEESVVMEGLSGARGEEEARTAIKDRIDQGLPVPYLMLRHRDKDLDDYIWHWFLLTGYEERTEGFFVKATTYGEWQWQDLHRLWDTGYDQKGGLILYSLRSAGEK